MRKSFIATVVLAALTLSCTAPKQVPYFHDIASGESSSYAVSQVKLVLQPEDKISIIVNCKDPQLSALFNLPYTARMLGNGNSELAGNSQGISGYTIDSEGNIDFPVIGKLKISGLSREEVAVLVKSELVNRNLVKDPVVTVDFQNLNFSVIGDVSHPGRFAITKDHMTVLDALSLAGDLAVTGERTNVRVIREEDGRQVSYTMDLCSMQSLVESPAYYIHQNDIIYVEPNKMKSRQSTVNGNNVLSASFWVSVASLLTSVTSTVVMLSR